MVSYWQSSQLTGRALALSLLRSLVFPPILLAVLPVLLGRELMWGCQSFGELLAAACALGMLLAGERTKCPQAGKHTVMVSRPPCQVAWMVPPSRWVSSLAMDSPRPVEP